MVRVHEVNVMRVSLDPKLLLLFLWMAPLLSAQKEHRQPLTETQVEQIREAGIDPGARVKLYTKFLGEHVDAIKGLTNRAHSASRSKRLDDELQDLTALMDEFGSNLDQYGERKADMRVALKALNEATPHWLEALNALPSEPVFDLSRKEAIDSEKDLADQTAQMLKEQTDYFNLHKDEKGQDRAEPKPQ
jgi:protein-tyrosine-phosphatase